MGLPLALWFAATLARIQLPHEGQPPACVRALSPAAHRARQGLRQSTLMHILAISLHAFRGIVSVRLCA